MHREPNGQRGNNNSRNIAALPVVLSVSRISLHLTCTERAAFAFRIYPEASLLGRSGKDPAMPANCCCDNLPLHPEASKALHQTTQSPHQAGLYQAATLLVMLLFLLSFWSC